MRKWALAVVMSVNTLRDTYLGQQQHSNNNKQNETETETETMFSGILRALLLFRTGDIIFLPTHAHSHVCVCARCNLL